VAIFFPCLCGQPLRVDEDSAGTHALCPACGRVARAPSLQRANQALGIAAEAPTTPEPIATSMPEPVPVIPPLPGAKIVLVEETTVPPRPAAPPPPEEKPVYRLADVDERADAAARQNERRRAARILEQADRDLRERRRLMATWRRERDWSECLLYPLRAWPVVLGLAAVWATLLALIVAALPHRRELSDLMGGVFALLWLFALFGYTMAWLQTTLAAAIEGRAGFVFRPTNAPLQAARCGAEAAWCFLAGPSVVAAVAFAFWLNSGDLELADWFILWELGVVAVGYWVLALLAVWEGERFRDANPVAILRLVKSAGYRVPLAALLMALAVVAHGLLALGAVEALHHGAHGWLGLVGSCGGLLFWLLFLLRWLGLSRFRAWKARQQSEENAEINDPLSSWQWSAAQVGGPG